MTINIPENLSQLLESPLVVNIIEHVSQAFPDSTWFWVLILIFIVVLVRRMLRGSYEDDAETFGDGYRDNAEIKGSVGELIVNVELEQLPEEYKIFGNVYVPGRGGSVTEIDHIVVSPYGIFVVETKNFSGFLYGKEYSPRWTQVFNRHSKFRIGNPLQQNRWHIKHLMEYLNIPKNKFHSVVCFVGSAIIKTPMPDYVLTGEWAEYIQSFSGIILSPKDILRITDRLVQLECDHSLKSKHQRYLQEYA